MRHLVFAVLLSATVLVASPGDVLSPGGLSSVDFFKGARERASAAKAEVRNLMPVGQEHWQLYKVANRASLHETWTAEWTEREKRMADVVQQSVRVEGGIPVWRFVIPASINQFRNEKGLPFYYSRVMVKELVAVEPGRMYHLSYHLIPVPSCPDGRQAGGPVLGRITKGDSGPQLQALESQSSQNPPPDRMSP